MHEEVSRDAKGLYRGLSLIETGGICTFTLVLEDMFSFYVIPRCQMFRKTFLMKSHHINSHLSDMSEVYAVIILKLQLLVIYDES